MGGPGSGRKRGPRKAQPKGAAWRETRQRILARDGGICGICGHGGAGDVDHIVFTDDVGLYYAPGNLRAAHGSASRCPVCGQCCNQVRGGPQRQQQQEARAANGHGIPGAAVKNITPAAPVSEARARQLAASVPWPPPNHPADCRCRSQPRPDGYQVAEIAKWGRPQPSSRCW